MMAYSVTKLTQLTQLTELPGGADRCDASKLVYYFNVTDPHSHPLWLHPSGVVVKTDLWPIDDPRHCSRFPHYSELAGREGRRLTEIKPVAKVREPTLGRRAGP